MAENADKANVVAFGGGKQYDRLFLLGLIHSYIMFQVLGSRCLTGSALLDCHVLKGFGTYMIGILGRPYCPEWKTGLLLLDVNYSV